MLNSYHYAFLVHLNSFDVNFIVIGGQAAVHFSDKLTEDLDLWVEYRPENLVRYAKAHNTWAKKYPNHVHFSFSKIAGDEIRENTQIHIPDADVAVQFGSDCISLGEHIKIDILFSIPVLNFQCCLASATEQDGIRFLSQNAYRESQKHQRE